MKALAREVIKAASQKAGIDAAKVYELVDSDNLTIKRPYMTIQFLPEEYTRTGRKLGLTRTKTEIIRKRELYIVTLTVAANVLTDDEQWLSDFAYIFVASLPKGINDSRGNWVKIRAQKAEFSKPADKRVGDEVIEVFTKRDQLFMLTFTGRITTEEREPLLPAANINPYWGGYR